MVSDVNEVVELLYKNTICLDTMARAVSVRRLNFCLNT